LDHSLLLSPVMFAVFFGGEVLWLRYEGKKFDRKYGRPTTSS
jgi:hypothetical protein